MNERKGRSNHLARIQQAQQVERRFQPAHQIDFRRAARMAQLQPLGRADAMFGRDAASKVPHRGVFDFIHRLLGLRVAVQAGHPGDQVQVAVTDVAAIDAVAARNGRCQGRPAARGGGRHVTHLQADVVGDVRAKDAVESRDRIVHAPERLNFGQRMGYSRIAEHATFEQPLGLLLKG